MGPEPGSQLDRYSIEAILGEGGMGRVCRAFDTRLQRRVALKVLHVGDAVGDASGVVASALREARAAAAITHPNATAIYDAVELEGQSFIVMEYVPGTSLRQIIQGPSMPMALRMRWLVDIAGALAAAHQVGIVHRDVKPENVMVRDDGLVKVLDFGVARRAGTVSAQDTQNTTEHPTTSDRGSRLVGTPAYMSPEQIRGEAIDGRADQFSWGVVAYEVLTGRLPWKTAREFLGYIAAVLTEKPESMRALSPEIPPAVDAAILRILSKNPANRFPSMTAAAAELVPYAQDAHAGAASAPPSPLPLSSPAQSSRPRVAGEESVVARHPPLDVQPTTPSPVFDALMNGPASVKPEGRASPMPPAREPASSRPSAVGRLRSGRSGSHEAASAPPHVVVPKPPPSGEGLPSSLRRNAMPPPSGAAVPPARRSYPAGAPSSMPPPSGRVSVATPSAPFSLNRQAPEGYAKLHAPYFDTPVDVEGHVALLPPDATCKGVFFAEVLRVGARVQTASELSRAAGIPERRYTPFHDYPASESLRLTAAVARVGYGPRPLGEGLRRIGQRVFDAVLGTHVGRTIFGILGSDVEQMLLATPKTVRMLASFGRLTCERSGSHTFLFRARELPVFLETYQVGMVEGMLRHCRANGTIRVSLDDLSSGLLEVRIT